MQGNLDGFPPKDVLRTVYVEHDIDASEADTAVVAFVLADPTLRGAAALLFITTLTKLPERTTSLGDYMVHRTL